ncbi:MAG: SH3 domain-containing protein [Pseudomonadota bacterium]
MRCRLWPLAAVSLFAVVMNAQADNVPRLGPDSHEPVPRFVSLRTQGANGRHGPGLEHKVDWIYQRQGLPLEVTAESGRWRRVRDPDGAETWMIANNLDDHRTAFVKADQDVALRDAPRPEAHAQAWLAPGVVGNVTGCQGQWRRVAVGGRVGWVEKSALWGADDACPSDSH